MFTSHVFDESQLDVVSNAKHSIADAGDLLEYQLPNDCGIGNSRNELPPRCG